MKKLKYLIFCLAFLFAATLISAGCSGPGSETPALLSEGTDTAVTVAGYSDFSGPDSCFLKEGDKVAVIAPSALPGRKKVEQTVEGLKKWGYVPVEGKYASVEESTLENCVDDLKWALEDPEIRAVFCVRGGAASSEVLDAFPLSLIPQAGKPIIGYSDITTFLSAWTAAGLKSLHSPMSACFDGSYPDGCTEAVKNMMQGRIPVYQCEGSEYDIPGSAEGILIGGNLATLTTVLDTAYDCTAADEPFILFLEEVEEDYEHIQRFLTILEHQGVLDRAEGFIFGEWIDYPAECETYNGNSRGGEFKSAAEMISREFLTDRQIPAAFGFPAGHGDVNYPLLMGTKLKLDVGEDSYTLTWLNDDAQE